MNGTADGAPGKNAFSKRFVSPLFMGSTLNPINSSLIATALVPIAADMHVPVGRTAVLVSVLYMTSAIGQPTFGKLSEQFGPRRMFLLGILTVFLGGIVGGFGPDMNYLIVSRILLGIGTSSAYPSAMLLVRRRASYAGLKEPPGNVLGGLMIAAMVTVAIGLPVGGVLVEALGWRTTFLINIPFALVALGLTLAGIPRDPPMNKSGSAKEIASRIDLTGTVLFAGMLTSLMIFLFSIPNPLWIALAVGIVLIASLILWELRAPMPFIDVRLLAENLPLTRTYVRFALANLCVYTILYGLTQWIQAGRGISAEGAGILLLPMTVVSAVIARLASRRNLVRSPLLFAAVSSVAGSAGIMMLTTSVSIAWIAVVTIVFGVTLGTTSTGNQTTLYTEVKPSQIATASGLFRTFGYIGSIASSAIIAIAFNTRVSDQGLHFAGIIMLVVSVLSLLLVLADRKVMRTGRITATRAES